MQIIAIIALISINFILQSMQTKSKVAWIVGASSGIGKALANKLGTEGFKLVLSARNELLLNELKKEYAIKFPGVDVLVVPLDLENAGNFGLLVNQVVQHFGQIDLLLLSGGVSQRSFAIDSPLQLDRKIMEVNYFGNIALTKSVLPQFIAQGFGHIVVITSIAGKFGFFLRSAYSASKHALHGFFDSLRLELYANPKTRQIAITLICPGKIQTEISKHALDKNLHPTQQMDEAHENCMSAEACANHIYRSIENKAHEQLIGGKELMAVYLKRFLPGLLFKTLVKQKIQ